jgi:hypothetical protein
MKFSSNWYFFKNKSILSLLLIFSSLAFTGCPENVTAVDVGVIDGGEEVIAGSDQDVDDMGCLSDEDCGSNTYCATDENDGLGACLPGCKRSPIDSCARPGSRQICDLETRACVLSCENDNECYEDQYCSDGICTLGCRLNEEDSELNRCPSTEQGPQYCDEETRTCLQGGVCCDLDDQCSISPLTTCEQVGGEILLGVLTCEPNPCRALCSRDSQCPEGDFCADFGRCAPGCRAEDPQGCPTNLTCHPVRHECVNLLCEANTECPDWQYCAFEGRCRDGCREGGCPEGLTCGEDHVCRLFCSDDDRCANGEYCDDNQALCRPTCDPLTHQGCSANEACLEGRCVLGCPDDPYEINDDQSMDVAPLIEWSLGENAGVRSSGIQSRILCSQDEDWLKISMAQGERIEVVIESRPSSGPLEVSLLNALGEVLATNDPWSITYALRYPIPGQGVDAGEYYLRVRAMSQIETHPYQLEVRVTPQDQACFSDRNDPNDDTPSGAQQFGLTPALRFTEQARGDLCFGDRDYYCFPLSMSDGLSIFLDTPSTCDQVSVQLAPSSIFELPLSDFEGYTASVVSAEDQPLRRYELSLDPETQAFSNDEWCLSLSTEGSCEGYEMSASFSRRQLVCSDLREPNNTVSQSTRLDQDGPLADGTGYIPINQDLNLSENLFLCQGDRDVLSVRSSAGDAWRAWIIDDSDPEDDPLRGRGQLVGDLKVRFLNSDGIIVGDSASINPSSDDSMLTLQYATAVSAVDEPLFIEVYGVDDSAGPYQLFLRRIPSDGACSQDVNEPSSRDDELNPVSQLRPEGEGRLAINNGYLCDPDNGFDEDWFTFEVAQANTRLCLNSTFRHRDGNINVELFEAMDATIGDFCTIHADCRTEQVNSSCIGRRCRAPLSRANSQDDGEMIHFNSLETQPGRYYARVYSPQPTENAYQLNVTMVPPSSECEDDIHEGNTGNNRPQDATRFGSGRIELCDTWLCESERSQGDWYEVVVPASAQRTVHVAFESQQGRLTLSALDASNINGQVVDSPRSQSRNVHCINIIAGVRPASVKLHIVGDTFNINQTRLDYLLRVVPTNLNTTPRGACDLINNGLFTEAAWPTLDLRD